MDVIYAAEKRSIAELFGDYVKQDVGPDEIDVTVCSLEQPERLPPKDHTHASSRLGWIRRADRLPEYPQSRS